MTEQEIKDLDKMQKEIVARKVQFFNYVRLLLDGTIPTKNEDEKNKWMKMSFIDAQKDIAKLEANYLIKYPD